MIKKFVTIFVFLFLTCSIAVAANTIVVEKNIIQISTITTNFKISDAITVGYFGTDWKVVSIEFFGGALNDRLVVKNGSDVGPVLMDKYIVEDIKYSSTKYFFGAKIDPVIDVSACTLSTGHKVIITLQNY